MRGLWFIFKTLLKFLGLYSTPRPASVNTPSWAEIERQNQARQARNERPYSLDDLPANAEHLTLLYYYFGYRDEIYAMVHLLRGQVPIPTQQDKHKLFGLYWEAAHQAIWSYRADNLSDRLSARDLNQHTRERLAQMRSMLENAGWQVTETRFPADNLELYYLQKA